jgi:hypothetical protein
MILITEIKSPVLDGMLNYFPLKEIVIEDKAAKWLVLVLLLGEHQERSLKLFAA